MNLGARRLTKYVCGLWIACFLLMYGTGLPRGAAEGMEAGGEALRLGAFTQNESGVATAAVTAEGLWMAYEEQPLYDVTLQVSLAEGTPEGAIWLAALRVDQTNAAAITLQTQNAAGDNNDVQRTLTGGQTLALPEGTQGLTLRYYSAESDFRLMPAGFQAGQVACTLACSAAALPEAAATLRLNGSMEPRSGANAGTRISLPEQVLQIQPGLEQQPDEPTAMPMAEPATELSAEPGEAAVDAPAAVQPQAPTADAPTAMPVAEPATELSAEPGETAASAPADAQIQAPATDVPGAMQPQAPTADAPTAMPMAEPATELSAEPGVTAAGAPAAVQPQAPTAVPTPIPTAVPTPVPTPVPTATPAPTQNPTPTPTSTPTPTPVTVAAEGCAYLDADGSLTRTEGEQLISGVQVRLQRLENGAWADVAETMTDAYGQYVFEQPSEGDYRVCATTDAAGYFVAAVGGEARLAELTAARAGQALSLRNGDRSTGASDISVQVAAALSFTAFHNTQSDGARRQGDRSAQGVRVEVMEGDAVLAYGITDKDGQAELLSVPTGAHPLRVTLPDQLAFTVKGGDSCVGSDGTGAASALSDSFPFVAGQRVTAGAGVIPMGSFSGKVFEDLNNDGIMDENDPGVAGVILRLEGQRKGNVYTLTTDDTGLYSFRRVPNDLYVFTATLPEGMLYARYSKTGGDLRSVFSGSVVSREFPVSNAADVTDKNVGVVQKGVLGGTVFLDLNYNGYRDEGEPGFAGVTLEAIRMVSNESRGKTVSDKDGAFRLEGLRGGDYRLRAILPDDGTIFTVVPAAGGDNANPFAQRGTRRENSVQPVNITSGGEAQMLVGVAVGATVRGTVFQDTDYNGRLNGKEKKYSGVAVRLVDQAGNVAASATTNGEGKYALTGIMPGTYIVQVKRTSGNGFTRLRPNEDGGSHVVELIGDYGVTAPMEIAMGQTLENINAGMLPSATVTGKLFHDLNDDGLLSQGESGFTQATVRLRSGDGEIDLTRPVAEDGTYFFDGVMPGDYTLTFQLPEHAEIARVAAGGNTLENAGRETETASFAVAMGEAYEVPLVGGVVLGSFAGVAFCDANANGVRDEGEAPLPGVTVTLTSDRALAEEKTETTGKDGQFALDGLRPAEYKLTLTLPEGYIFSHELDGEGLRLNPVSTQTLACPWEVLVNRAEKALGAVKPAVISGVIWLDENKDGQRAKAETLMDGVQVELVDESTQAVAARVGSTGGGFLFNSVRPGMYTVRFVLPAQSEPAQDAASTFTFAAPYLQQTGVTVKEGQKIDGLTTGLVSKTSVGGTVSLEENGRSTVPGVTVSLYLAGESAPLQTAVTDENGGYRFDGLWPGEYVLEASLPEGMIFVRPDDANYPPEASVIQDIGESAGTSERFPLQMAQHLLSQNVLYIRPAKVGDQAWLDDNRNGLMDGGESLIPGVQIALTQNGKAVYETVTDAFGYYLFDAVYPGAYTLEAVAYPELEITKPGAGPRMISSCLATGDGTKAASDELTVASGQADMDYNLGYAVKDGQTRPAAIKAPPRKDWTVQNEKYTALQE